MRLFCVSTVLGSNQVTQATVRFEGVPNHSVNLE